MDFVNLLAELSLQSKENCEIGGLLCAAAVGIDMLLVSL